ncbi:potassium channel family protein [Halobaculum sp. D14]|uniref:potassium channel family protein n=1 Tax=unclassified Halobaculum TaxID=2640896 RepID=UPI003EC03017
MYTIVVGAGAIGSQVIDLLERTRNEIVVVESDAEVAEAVSRNHDYLVINDDATVKETLVDAGADDADAVITTTDADATNIMVMLLAEELGIESKVSVVQNPEHMDVFRRIGVNVLENPQRLIGEYLVRAVQRPSVKDFMSLAGGAEVFEITLAESAPLAETTLAAADDRGLLGDDILVVAIERGQDVITPRGETTMHAGDLVTVFSKQGVSADVMRTFTGES